MEAVYFGSAKGGLNHGGAGKGPWIMAGDWNGDFAGPSLQLHAPQIAVFRSSKGINSLGNTGPVVEVAVVAVSAAATSTLVWSSRLDVVGMGADGQFYGAALPAGDEPPNNFAA